MEKGRADTEGGSALFVRPTVLDAGIGVLYFFTSHMVIRAMYSIGVDRTSTELSVFFLVVIASVIAAHLLSRPLLRARRFAESALGIPAVSVTAALGATLALVSMLPVVDVGLFYVSGALLGLACGWIIVIWTSTIHASRPESASFYLDPALVVAVVCYFLFRCVSSFSDTIAQGFLLALPLVTIACIIRAAKPADEGDAPALGEGTQALQVLVAVAAAFAIGCSVTVYLAGRENDVLSSGLNYMVLFEVLAVILMAFCCWLMSRFSQQRGALSPRGTAVLSFCVCYLPLFSIGLVMGGAAIPSNAPGRAVGEQRVGAAHRHLRLRHTRFGVRHPRLGRGADVRGHVHRPADRARVHAELLVVRACGGRGADGAVLLQRGRAAAARGAEEETAARGGEAGRGAAGARRGGDGRRGDAVRDAGVLPQARAGERLDAAGGRDTRAHRHGAQREVHRRGADDLAQHDAHPYQARVREAEHPLEAGAARPRAVRVGIDVRRARAAGAGGVFARGGIGKRLKRHLPLFTALIGVAWGAGGV